MRPADLFKLTEILEPLPKTIDFFTKLDPPFTHNFENVIYKCHWKLPYKTYCSLHKGMMDQFCG